MQRINFCPFNYNFNTFISTSSLNCRKKWGVKLHTYVGHKIIKEEDGSSFYTQDSLTEDLYSFGRLIKLKIVKLL